MKSTYLPALAIVAGIGLLFLSFAVPSLARWLHPWSDDDARAKLQAAAEMGQHNHGDSEEDKAATRLPTARVRYEELQQRFEQSRDAGHTAALVCRWLGAAMVLLGVVVYGVTRSDGTN